MKRFYFAASPWVVMVCLCGVILLTGCPQAKTPPTPAVSPVATDDNQPADEPDVQNDPQEDPVDAPPKVASLDDSARENFIAEMRELGVSVELNDDNQIISLVMGFTKMDDARLAKLPPLPHLEFLGLDHTEVTDAGLKTVAGWTSLKVIQLGGNDLSAAGIKQLAGLTKLEYLDLSDLPIGDDALKPLSGLKSLTKLNLTQTKVTLEGTIAFAKELPELEVSAPFGNLVGGSRLTMAPGSEDADLAKLKSLDSLRELNLWECDKITDAAMQHLWDFEQLTSVELGYTQITDAGLAKLESLGNLQQLDIRETNTSVAAALAMASRMPDLHILADWGTVDGPLRLALNPEATDEQLADLKHLPEVQTLNLWRCDKLTDEAMTQVAKCGQLRELNLGATNIGDAGVKSLAKLPHLQRLVLANTPVTDEGAATLATMKSLTDLDVSSTGISDDGLKSLGELTKLEQLNLARTAVTDEGLTHLVALEHLSTLDLQETGVTGTFDPAVIEGLYNLESLDLSLTLVDDAALAKLAKLMSIKRLELWGTRVTDDGIEHLHDVGLTHLGLFGTAVNEEAVDSLKKEMQKNDWPPIKVTLGFTSEK